MNRLRKPPKMAAGLLAGIALLVSLVLIVSSLAAGKPTLSFEGLAFKVMDDGSVQASVDVCVEKVDMATGAYFIIDYNSAYLNPSNKASNALLEQDGLAANTQFFAISKTLYGIDENGEPLNPFLADPTDGLVSGTGFGYCALDTNGKKIYIRCALNQAQGELTEKGKIKKVSGGGESEESRYYFDTKTEKTVVGTMTFRVKAEDIQKIVETFGNAAEPSVDDYLLREVTAEPGNYTWRLPYTNANLGSPSYDKTNADIKFNYQFPKTLISATAAAPRVEVNAWQAYQTGTMDDLAATLRTHSPMVTAGYSNGTVQNFVLPWGSEASTDPLQKDYTVYQYDESAVDHKGPEVTAYSPTGGKYVVEQYFYHEGLRFPLPILVELTVKPITVTGATADGLDKTYRLADAITTYSTYDSLELPAEARLMTDVLPGGATLSMPIPGWTPGHTDDMTTLKNGNTPEPGSWPKTVADTTGIGTYTFQFVPGFTDAEVSARYPWLTVGVTTTYNLTATRTIVADDGVVDAGEYTVLARHNATTPGTMELVVERQGKVMAANATFRVLLPGGQELESAWFVGDGVYAWEETSGYYTGTVTPGIKPEDTAAANHELLRRAINLGGWFSVSVQEEPAKAASNFIPVYLAPRTNVYTESKIYNFTGVNAGLFSYFTPLGTTVTLPRGTYLPVGDDGALQETPEFYGVTTTYDGATGGEPGRLYTFAVDTPWATGGPIYGPNSFATTKYGGYGKVENTTPPKTATIKTDKDTPTLPGGGELELTYTGDGTVTTGVDKRMLAIYDTRQVGYTYRQEYRFILTNTGTAAVSGIQVNPRLASFQVLGDGPATYLAPGGSTTFVLTYAYGLEANDSKKFYFDTIDVNYDGTKTLDFDAQFRVSLGPVRRVTVVTLPKLTAPQTMGTAGLIVGETDTTSKTMDYTESAPNYEAGSTFWLSAVPTEEYLVKRVYYYERNNPSGTEVPLTKYAGGAPLTPGTDVYSGIMPGYNVTVYVELYEPVSSKLRLSALMDYAAADDEGLKPTLLDPPPQKLWQKAFTEDEAKKTDGEKMKLGKADTAKPDFDSQVNQYLVVIPAEAAKSQVEVTLRELDIDFKLPDGTVGNPDITPRVQIVLVGDKPGDDITLYDSIETGSDLGYTPEMGDTAIPTTHTGKIFLSPEEKKSAYVQVTLSAEEEIEETTNTVYRHYYLEIVRDTTNEVGKLGYGNSPYGMIMNATNIATVDKAAAKEVFVTGGYKFSQGYIPAKATALTNIYWPDAWGGAATAEAGNYDLDDMAFFALLGQDCVAPSLSEVKDSSGRAVEPKDIKRTAQATLTGGNPVTLDLKTAAETGAIDWQANPDGTSGKYAVAPGTYILTYTYVDYDGTTERTFTRPFLVLGAVGDLNADGIVKKTRGDASDLDTLQNRFAVPIPYAAEKPAFRLRTCDVNNDRNLNNIDANALQYKTPITAFYLPGSY